MSDGLFIVLEGIEGAGKSTQVDLLAGWMEGMGISTLATREPGGTDVGEEIREILLSWKHVSIPSETELFLILAARAAFVRGFVEPALETGSVVLADRYDLSTLAYQGYGRGLDLELVGRANELATGGRRPDLYVILDIEVEEGLARQRRGGKEEDRIEGAGIAFLRRVREGYRSLARSRDRVELVSAAGSVEEVQERIRSVLSSRFPETFG